MITPQHSTARFHSNCLSIFPEFFLGKAQECSLRVYRCTCYCVCELRHSVPTPVLLASTNVIFNAGSVKAMWSRGAQAIKLS